MVSQGNLHLLVLWCLGILAVMRLLVPIVNQTCGGAVQYLIGWFTYWRLVYGCLVCAIAIASFAFMCMIFAISMEEFTSKIVNPRRRTKRCLADCLEVSGALSIMLVECLLWTSLTTQLTILSNALILQEFVLSCVLTFIVCVIAGVICKETIPFIRRCRIQA